MGDITFNKAESRYEQALPGGTVFADIRTDKDIVYITHVEAPASLRGTGAAGNFMQGLMEKLHGEHTGKVVPLCGYAAAWLARHKEFSDLL